MGLDSNPVRFGFPDLPAHETDSFGHPFWYVKTLDWCPWENDTYPVTAITFSCATIYFPSVYNLQGHQRSVPLIPSLQNVGG